MRVRNKFRVFRNLLKQFKLPFFMFILFWILGIIVLFAIEDNKEFWHIFSLSICVTSAGSNPIFIGLYQLLWPLLFELLILSFILSTIRDFYGYNPIVSARRYAYHQSNHSVILGYNHLGERIVDYLKDHNRSYSLIEIDFDKVEDLVNFNEPVVVGDYTDKKIMELAGVRKCKEVFCVTSDLRRALIAAEKVRELNKYCNLYMRVFDEHFRDYLSDEPWNAFTFSTSKWAMDSVMDWSEDIDGNDEVIILGNDNIVRRIVCLYGEILQAKTYLVDPKIDPEVYNAIPNVQAYRERVQFLENLDERFNLNNISQIYICWNTAELFSDAILLTVGITQKYPQIGLFVRMFDEELANIAKAIGASTFSTSAYAFKMLQKEVKQNSGIHPLLKE